MGMRSKKIAPLILVEAWAARQRRPALMVLSKMHSHRQHYGMAAETIVAVGCLPGYLSADC